MITFGRCLPWAVLIGVGELLKTDSPISREKMQQIGNYGWGDNMTDTHCTSNDLIIREMVAARIDRAVWVEMRVALWPDESPETHLKMIDALRLGEDAFAFIAQAPDGTPCGFAEVAIRKYANGCETMPVPFLEGIWVKEQFRRQGIGKRLIKHIEAFLAARAFSELGSDTQIDNCVSQAAHLAWQFSETERVVYFRKLLKAAVD